MPKHMTGTRKEWLAARLALLEAEKELTRRSDELARRRQELPWVRIDKEYRFETDEGRASLTDLFRARSTSSNGRRSRIHGRNSGSVHRQVQKIFQSESSRKQRRNKMATSKERDKEHPKGHLAMKTPPIVSQQEWEAARQQLLVKEKALTRSRDALAAERRRMPWMAVEKKYEFDGPKGKVSLFDLFEGRRQLIVYRAFFEPGVKGYPERACVGCSLVADQVAHPAHLNARDTTLVFASRAPQADIQRLKQRHGWDHIPWFSITDDFDKDFDVDNWHGTNAFIRDDGRFFRTYFI